MSVVEIWAYSLLGAGVLGNSLGSLRDSVLGKLSWKEKPDSSLDLPGGDGGPLVVMGEPAGLSGNALEQVVDKGVHDGSHVDWSTSSNTGSIVTLAEKTVDTPNGELESSTAGSGLCLSLDLASFATSRHDDACCLVVSNKTGSPSPVASVLSPQTGSVRADRPTAV